MASKKARTATGESNFSRTDKRAVGRAEGPTDRQDLLKRSPVPSTKARAAAGKSHCSPESTGYGMKSGGYSHGLLTAYFKYPTQVAPNFPYLKYDFEQ